MSVDVAAAAATAISSMESKTVTQLLPPLRHEVGETGLGEWQVRFGEMELAAEYATKPCDLKAADQRIRATIARERAHLEGTLGYPWLQVHDDDDDDKDTPSERRSHVAQLVLRHLERPEADAPHASVPRILHDLNTRRHPRLEPAAVWYQTALHVERYQDAVGWAMREEARGIWSVLVRIQAMAAYPCLPLRWDVYEQVRDMVRSEHRAKQALDPQIPALPEIPVAPQVPYDRDIDRSMAFHYDTLRDVLETHKPLGDAFTDRMHAYCKAHGIPDTVAAALPPPLSSGDLPIPEISGMPADGPLREAWDLLNRPTRIFLDDVVRSALRRTVMRPTATPNAPAAIGSAAHLQAIHDDLDDRAGVCVLGGVRRLPRWKWSAAPGRGPERSVWCRWVPPEEDLIPHSAMREVHLALGRLQFDAHTHPDPWVAAHIATPSNHPALAIIQVVCERGAAFWVYMTRGTHLGLYAFVDSRCDTKESGGDDDDGRTVSSIRVIKTLGPKGGGVRSSVVPLRQFHVETFDHNSARIVIDCANVAAAQPCVFFLWADVDDAGSNYFDEDLGLVSVDNECATHEHEPPRLRVYTHDRYAALYLCVFSHAHTFRRHRA